MNVKKMRYYFMRIYTNDEIDRILTSMLDQGLVLEGNQGNYLFFHRKNLQGARLQTISMQSSKQKASEDPAVKEHIEYALKQGWQLLCVGSVESLLPMRRRLYFFTQDSSAARMPPDASEGFFEANRAKSVTFRWIVYWAIFMFVVLFTSIPFMSTEGIAIPLLLLNASLTLLTIMSVMMHLNRRAALRRVTSGNLVAPFLTRRLRVFEKIMGIGFCGLLLGMISLLFS